MSDNPQPCANEVPRPDESSAVQKTDDDLLGIPQSVLEKCSKAELIQLYQHRERMQLSVMRASAPQHGDLPQGKNKCACPFCSLTKGSIPKEWTMPILKSGFNISEFILDYETFHRSLESCDIAMLTSFKHFVDSPATLESANPYDHQSWKTLKESLLKRFSHLDKKVSFDDLKALKMGNLSLEDYLCQFKKKLNLVEKQEVVCDRRKKQAFCYGLNSNIKQGLKAMDGSIDNMSFEELLSAAKKLEEKCFQDTYYFNEPIPSSKPTHSTVSEPTTNSKSTHSTQGSQGTQTNTTAERFVCFVCDETGHGVRDCAVADKLFEKKLIERDSEKKLVDSRTKKRLESNRGKGGIAALYKSQLSVKEIVVEQETELDLGEINIAQDGASLNVFQNVIDEPLASTFSMPSIKVKVDVNDINAGLATIDSGARGCVISKRLAESLQLPLSVPGPLVCLADGTKLPAHAIIKQGKISVRGINAYVDLVVLEQLPSGLILGRTWEVATMAKTSNRSDGSAKIKLTDPKTRETSEFIIDAEHEPSISSFNEFDPDDKLIAYLEI